MIWQLSKRKRKRDGRIVKIKVNEKKEKQQRQPRKTNQTETSWRPRAILHIQSNHRDVDSVHNTLLRNSRMVYIIVNKRTHFRLFK